MTKIIMISLLSIFFILGKSSAQTPKFVQNGLVELPTVFLNHSTVCKLDSLSYSEVQDSIGIYIYNIFNTLTDTIKLVLRNEKKLRIGIPIVEDALPASYIIKDLLRFHLDYEYLDRIRTKDDDKYRLRIRAIEPNSELFFSYFFTRRSSIKSVAISAAFIQTSENDISRSTYWKYRKHTDIHYELKRL